MPLAAVGGENVPSMAANLGLYRLQFADGRVEAARMAAASGMAHHCRGHSKSPAHSVPRPPAFRASAACRVYPAAPAVASSHTDELIAELRARLDDMRAALAAAERNAETWPVAFEREQAQRALPTPSTDAQQAVHQDEQPPGELSRFRRAWRWMRATG
jgi:hypothetical protein